MEKKYKFKDGDILYAEDASGKSYYIMIFKEECNSSIVCHAGMINNGKPKFDINYVPIDTTLKLATQNQVVKLMKALAYDGKVWDAEKKQIIPINESNTPNKSDDTEIDKISKLLESIIGDIHNTSHVPNSKNDNIIEKKKKIADFINSLDNEEIFLLSLTSDYTCSRVKEFGSISHIAMAFKFSTDLYPEYEELIKIK